MRATYQATLSVLSPDAPFRLYWDIMLMLMLAYISVMLPWQVAFQIPAKQDFGFGVIGYIIDAVFLAVGAGAEGAVSLRV